MYVKHAKSFKGISSTTLGPPQLVDEPFYPFQMIASNFFVVKLEFLWIVIYTNS